MGLDIHRSHNYVLRYNSRGSDKTKMDAKLYRAASADHHEINIVRDFSIPNACHQVTCGRGNTILHVAALSGNKHTAEHILRSHPSLAFRTNTKGDTPLHIAARLGHLEVAILLTNDLITNALEEGTSPLQKVNIGKNTALHEAVRNGHFNLVKLLMEKDQLLASFTNDIGESPLFLAVDKTFDEIALWILETFPNCSLLGRNGMTVMHAAIIRNLDCKHSLNFNLFYDLYSLFKLLYLF